MTVKEKVNSTEKSRFNWKKVGSTEKRVDSTEKKWHDKKWKIRI